MYGAEVVGCDVGKPLSAYECSLTVSDYALTVVGSDVVGKSESGECVRVCE